MSAQQQLVGAAGVGLVIANAVTGKQRADLAAVFGGGWDTARANTAAKQIGGELLGVGVLVLLAGASKAAGNACLAALVALWVLWLINRPAGRRAANQAATGSPYSPDSRPTGPR